ncbi:MAG: GNAT family N-acetyltransferase [Nanoarchaeota archaeon]
MIVEVTRGTLSTFKEVILKTEEVFPSELRTPWEDYEYMLLSDRSIALIMTHEGMPVGNIFGCVLHAEEMEELGVSDPDALYIFSFAIDHEFQGKGLGKMLLNEFIARARERKFPSIVGHFRMNSSLALIKKVGGVEKGLFENWDGTNESVVFCELDLRIPPLQVQPLQVPVAMPS